MSTPAKLNFKIYQGATFNEVLRWESSVKVYTPITAITKSAPIVITAPGHNVPPEWRVRFTNLLGMPELNSVETYHQVSNTTADTITINAINSLGFKDYISGGVVEYNQPIDLSDYTARLQVRSKIDSPDIILELTTENGGIVINSTTKAVLIVISATATAALSFSTAVFSLEMVSSGGQVTPIVGGTISLIKEVTR